MYVRIVRFYPFVKRISSGETRRATAVHLPRLFVTQCVNCTCGFFVIDDAAPALKIASRDASTKRRDAARIALRRRRNNSARPRVDRLRQLAKDRRLPCKFNWIASARGGMNALRRDPYTLGFITDRSHELIADNCYLMKENRRSRHSLSVDVIRSRPPSQGREWLNVRSYPSHSSLFSAVLLFYSDQVLLKIMLELRDCDAT